MEKNALEVLLNLFIDNVSTGIRQKAAPFMYINRFIFMLEARIMCTASVITSLQRNVKNSIP